MDITFDDIIDIRKFQSIQDYFSQALGLSLRTINPRGISLTQISGPSQFPAELVTGMMPGDLPEYCQSEDAPLSENWRHGRRCVGNFYIFAVPLNAASRTLAYMIVGPIIVGKRESTEHYRSLARRLNIDAGSFIDVVRDMKSFSFHGIKTVLELLYEVGGNLCELGYKAAAPHKAPEITPAQHNDYVEKLLNALLETSFVSAHADRGSLMLWDKDSNELYIQAARGLAGDVIAGTRVKAGEGLAGLVAQKKEPIIVDDSVKDPAIRSRMHSPELKRSYIMPLKVRKQLVGILNLGSHKSAPASFSPKDRETVDRLAHLVETTLSSLPELF